MDIKYQAHLHFLPPQISSEDHEYLSYLNPRKHRFLPFYYICMYVHMYVLHLVLTHNPEIRGYQNYGEKQNMSQEVFGFIFSLFCFLLHS